MADSFGLKIGLEGEKEFKKALADINQSFKVLGSEMKLATSQFDKNDKSVEALAARNKVLRKEIDEQTTKIDTLRKALQNAATSFGENDRRTQNWQIQLNNAEAALNDMNRELDENEKAIKEGGKAAEESGSKFEGFGKVLKTVGVALGAVAVAAGAAAVKLGKEVITAYADYEQLVGGVDTLFKDSSQEIQRYAANAYKTAGLSANEYMETVTGFSASLIQSLGGDTEKAAKYADMAITDMSDNANKMGTDMSSIQNAYQGFNRRRAQRQNGRGERSRHALAQLFHGGADGRALFPEGRQRIACLRPCGLHPGKAFGGRANLLLGLPKRALGVIQIGVGLRNRIRVVLQAFRIGRQLALQLFDLGGGLRILLRKRV